MQKNIILDFMDPENRMLYGTYKNYTEDDHIRLLCQSLNLAVFLCGEYCILPPCAVMQCICVRKTLEIKSDFLDEGLIKFPVRERTLNEFFEKKKRNYMMDKEDDDYKNFFSTGGSQFLLLHKTEIIKRNTKVGESIAIMVESLPIDDPLWADLLLSNPRLIDKLRTAPSKVLEANEAISVKTIKRLLNLTCDEDVDFQIGRILQNKYFTIYIDEYDANIIHGIPPKTTDFLMKHYNNAYEFSYVKYLLKLLGIFDYVSNCSAQRIIRLRQFSSYYDFIDSLVSIGQGSIDVSEAKKIASLVVEKIDIANIEDIESEVDKLKAISIIMEKFSKAYQDLYGNGVSNNEFQYKDKYEYVERLKTMLTSCDMSKPYVFIGYNRADSEEEVYKDCIMLGKMGVNYWIDNANMNGCKVDSEGWKSVVVSAITNKNCKAYIPYISPSFFSSIPCCNEVKSFFNLNKNVDILLILKNGFNSDSIIRKILEYDNILQLDDVNNMIKLFKITNNNGMKSIDQPYREYVLPYFTHYVNDRIFYKTFIDNKIIDSLEYDSYEKWYSKAQVVSLETPI